MFHQYIQTFRFGHVIFSFPKKILFRVNNFQRSNALTQFKDNSLYVRSFVHTSYFRMAVIFIMFIIGN